MNQRANIKEAISDKRNIVKNCVLAPKAVIKRLPRYSRILGELMTNTESISSTDLGEQMGITASQIRQDLSNFGTFGLQGYGYRVKMLHDQINVILGLGNSYTMVLVGAGNLGRSISNYIQSGKSGFDIIALFDLNPKRLGLKIKNIEIMEFGRLSEFLKEHSVDIGIITTSKNSAQGVADKLVAGGVKGIWNFSMTDLVVPDNVVIENVHLSDSLYLLTYQINQTK